MTPDDAAMFEAPAGAQGEPSLAVWGEADESLQVELADEDVYLYRDLGFGQVEKLIHVLIAWRDDVLKARAGHVPGPYEQASIEEFLTDPWGA